MEKGIIKPRKLKPGDRVAAVSLSWGGPGALLHRYQAGKRQLEETFGLQVVEMPHTLSAPDWLSQHPQARADDLMQAFSDPSIKAIITTIGGDDSIRTLPYLDLDIMRANPKIFMGYSDTTITHLACFKAGLVSFYGPSIMSGFAENGGIFPYMVDSVRETLFTSDPVGEIKPNTNGWTVELLDWGNPQNQSIKRKLQPSEGWKFLQGKGIHSGHLIGGCLEVLDWLRGTNFWPNEDEWKNAVLFLETSEEAPSPAAVSRMLRTLGALGILEKLAGLIFGRPGGQILPEEFNEYDQTILQVIVKEEGFDHLPIITRMDFGHTDPMMVLPYGLQMQINCDEKKVEITENGVTD